MKKSFLLSLLIFALLGGATTRTIADEASSVENVSEEKLCGINAAFLALHLLGHGNVRYDEVLARFPLATTRGVNLLEIQEFMKKTTNLPCKITFCNEREILKFNPGVVAFVLTETGEFPHILLKQSETTEAIKVFNPPNVTTVKQLSLSSEKLPTLIVGNINERLPVIPILLGFIWIFIAFVLARKAKPLFSKMKAVFIILFLAVPLTSFAAKEEAVFPLRLQESDVDLGRLGVKDGLSKGLGKIIIINDSDEDAVIEKLEISCSCLTPIQTPSVAKKKSKTEIAFEISFSPSTIEPRVTKGLIFFKGRPVPFVFSVTAAAQFSVMMGANEIDFGQMTTGRTAKRYLAISAPSPVQLREIVASVESKVLGKRISFQKNGNTNYQVQGHSDKYFPNIFFHTIALTATEEGRHSDEVKIKLTTGDEKILIIKHLAVPAQQFSPNEFLLTKEMLSDGQDFKITFSSAKNDIPKRFFTNSEAFSVSLENQDDGDFYLLLKCAPEKLIVNSEIHLGVELMSGKVLKMPIRFQEKLWGNHNAF